MNVTRSALARCIGDVDKFARESWGCAPVVVRAADDSFADLLDDDVVDRS